MKTLPTAGQWRGARPHRTSSDWPFDWASDVTSFDPDTGTYRHIASIRQSGTRSFGEVCVNARSMTEAAAMAGVLGAIAHVLDMSDPEHDAFVDSAADCLDPLLAQGSEIRRIMAALAGSPPSPAKIIGAPIHY